METIYLLRRLIETYNESTWDWFRKASREIMWWVIQKKEVPTRFIDVIKDMYDGVTTRIRIVRGETNFFHNHRFASRISFKPVFFILVTDKLIRHT